MKPKDIKVFNPLDYPICLIQPLRLDNISAWIEHIPFGMFLIDALRPKVLVELGTHTGVSYSAFCQAVKQLGLDSRCYAVDTWKGDVHAGFFSMEVLSDLRVHHDPLYGEFSRLVQSTFDEALKYFSDGSIDLLHIDGLHTYEAVKHDFETWFPKLSQRAVVLFHDTNVRERGFGVWEFWAELQQKYPHFEFFHGHGLGVLYVGTEPATPELEILFSLSDDSSKRIREFFFTLGARLSKGISNTYQIQELAGQVGQKEQVTQSLLAQVNEKEQAVQSLVAQVNEKDQAVQSLVAQVNEKDQAVQSLVAQVNEKDQAVQSLVAQVNEKDQAVQSLVAQVKKEERIRTKQVDALTTQVVEREQALHEQQLQAAGREQTLLRLSQTLNTQELETKRNLQSLTDQITEQEKINASNLSLLRDREQILQTLNSQLWEIYGSRAWRLIQLLWRVRVSLLPHGSKQERLGRFVMRGFHLFSKGIRVILSEGWVSFWHKYKEWRHRNKMGDPVENYSVEIKPAESNPIDPYQLWIAQNEPNPEDLEKQRQDFNNFKYKPRISIVTPAWNSDIKWLRAAIDSVIDQTYANWELCIANSSPESAEIRTVLEECTKKDKRIKVLHLEKNLGISGNTNAALTLATGGFVGFLDHDDLLAPFALFEVVSDLNKNPNADLIYSDDDKIMETGWRCEPFSKPDFSPDMLRSMNYMRHFLVIRKSLGDEIGWFREAFDGVENYDLVLRSTEKTKNIAHVSKILYHRRFAQGVTAFSNDLDITGNKALQEHLDRSGLIGKVTSGLHPATYRVHYDLPEIPLVSIIIPSMDNEDYLNRCINSILSKSTYTNFEILVVENNSQKQSTFQLYEQLQALDARVSVLVRNVPFNYSSINNWAAERANGKILLFLNNDVEIISSGWLEEMLQHAIRPKIGAVGAKLYYPDGKIQHAGVVVSAAGGIAMHEHHGALQGAVGYFGRLTYVRNVSAVTAACMMIRKDVFNEVNGFDERYVLAYNDVDLCLKLQKNGYLNLWTPYAELYHYESKTRGYENTPEKQARFKQELDYFLQKWKGALQKGDPYYNPILPVEGSDFALESR